MSRITNLLWPVVDMKATGKKIKQLRLAGGYSVRDMQELFGFEYPQAVYAWECGRSLPTVDNLLVLSDFFGVAVDEIVIRKYPGAREVLSA
ncbi:MAG: helix-turn-helix transcriptional regulator [Treponema sp.]|nr:helix-turn-helix transcriptional regulator [Treponema sp.]